ncbi:hypothetical protein AAG906_019979 [Vitis piasezkii]
MEEVLPERIFPSLVALFIVVWIIWFIWLFNVLYLEPNKIRSPPAFVMGNIPEMKRIMSMAADAPRSETDHLPLGFSTSTTFLISLSGLSDMLNLDNKLSLSASLYNANVFQSFTTGGTFTFALGNARVLYVTDTKLVREINLSKTLDLGKPSYLQNDRGPLLGRTIAPQLFMDKVKGNLNIMVESVSDLVNSWLGLIELGRESADIRVDDYIRSFTSTVISKMVFGSHHSKGVELFPKCSALMKDLQTPTILKGFLSSDIMESAKTGELGPSTPDQYIVDNCKDVYLAGFEVTAVATLWGLVLLASNPEWQARLRAEVLEVCGGYVPDTNMLGKMKLMVIQEVLRLYPGVAFVSRQALKDVKLGDILVPKGVNIWIWIPALHQDPELWGSDAEKFNPERFANGISGACKSPNAYIPFGVGTRMCPGQNLAITEMKILFTIILSHFSLSLSPNYRHSPHLNLLLEPEYGVNLIIRKI